ncbi:HNH endonuclease [Marinifilum fragile]|uniref:HNH endonuclease n=1 Tax=Marinifilum fragile TaxID=570161 RepID=UPI002AA6A09B|nr:HNH endonuclease [Marinifilum fragile]
MINGKKLNEILKLNAKHSLYREDGLWYHNLKDFPGVLFDKNGYVIFRKEEDYLNNSQLQIRKDLHVINGISSLEEYVEFDRANRKIIALKSGEINDEVVRKIRQVNTIQRDKKIVQEIKSLYDNTCQICGVGLKITSDIKYSEIHHIKPLGKPHNGPDILGNLICVCPNHHVMLDLGAIPLEIDRFKLSKHEIDLEFIEYHNENIFSKCQ